MAEDKVKRKRLTRTDWLALAMDVLSNEGEAKLTIDKLCLRLGVTKGSFYAHFEDRAEFVRQFLAYWAALYTQTIIAEIDGLADEPGEARLLALMRLLQQKQSARYDIAIRSWAAHDPVVAEGVERVDALRFEYLRGIFHDIGFRHSELDLRTRLFVVYHSSDQCMRLPRCGHSVEQEISLLHAFFTRRDGCTRLP